MKKKMVVIAALLVVSMTIIGCDFPGQKEVDDASDTGVMLVLLSWLSFNNAVNNTYTGTYICLNAPTNCTQYLFAGTPTSTVNSLGSSCTGAGDVWTQGGSCSPGYTTFSSSGSQFGYSWTVYTP